MKRQDKRKVPAAAPAKGMSIDAIPAQLASMKDNAQSFIVPDPADPEGQEMWEKDVAACEAATDILTTLQDAGIKDPEQARDLIHDYNALALQYQNLHHKYEAGDRPIKLGNGRVFLCPACHQQQRPGNNNCSFCGHRLIWGR